MSDFSDSKPVPVNKDEHNDGNIMRRCGRVVKALDSGLKGTGFKPHRGPIVFFGALSKKKKILQLIHCTQVKMCTWPNTNCKSPNRVMWRPLCNICMQLPGGIIVIA